MTLDQATQVYAEHRELLFSLAYNLLGSIADTEDVLQETWLSWAARNENENENPEPIGNPRAYLVRIAVNQALTRREQVSRRRETYVGQWLPEPVLTTDDPAVRTESVEMALLVVLETLTPLERAVFVLHEVFGFAHTEIAGMLDRSPAAIRQLASRARAHVHARRPRYRTTPRVHKEVAERFVEAALGGDLEALLELLAPDVTIWADGLRPVTGRDKTIRMLGGYATRRPADLTVRYAYVNHSPSALAFAGDSLFVVLVLDLTTNASDQTQTQPQIQGIYAIANPDKLNHLEESRNP